MDVSERPTFATAYSTSGIFIIAAFWRFAMSYVTGSHAFKTGINDSPGYQETRTYNFQALQYRFNNGVPNQLTLLDAPWNFEETVNDFAFYVQDAWTVKRVTMNLGVRYNEVRGPQWQRLVSTCSTRRSSRR